MGLQLRTSFSEIYKRGARLTSVTIDSSRPCRWEATWHFAMPSTQLNPNRLTPPILQFRKPAIALRKHRYPSLYQVNTRVWFRRAVRGPKEEAPRAPRPTTCRAGRADPARLLRSPSRLLSQAGDPGRGVAFAGASTGVGQQPDMGLFRLPPWGYHVFRLETLE